MKRMALMFAALLVVSLAGASCQKKEQPPAPSPMQGNAPTQSGAPHGPMEGGVEKKVVVPEDVKETWKAVKIEVASKETKKANAYTVPLNSEFPVPDSDLVVETGAFLPHFSMTADRITSASNDPSNPACKVEIRENGKQVFEGWLFANFPDVHSFKHDKFSVKLLEGVKK